MCRSNNSLKICETKPDYTEQTNSDFTLTVEDFNIFLVVIDRLRGKKKAVRS